MKQPNQLKGYKLETNKIINLEQGKLPPQALDLEQVVLGAMMIDKKGVDEVIDILSPEAFYKESHRYISNPFLNFLKIVNQLIYLLFHLN